MTSSNNDVISPTLFISFKNMKFRKLYAFTRRAFWFSGFIINILYGQSEQWSMNMSKNNSYYVFANLYTMVRLTTDFWFVFLWYFSRISIVLWISVMSLVCWFQGSNLWIGWDFISFDRVKSSQKLHYRHFLLIMETLFLY